MAMALFCRDVRGANLVVRNARPGLSDACANATLCRIIVAQRENCETFYGMV